MNIGLRIRELASKEKLEISEIAEKLGKSKQAVYDMLSKQDLSTSVLRELSVILRVPITAFFQENNDFDSDNSIQEKLELAYQEIERLRKEIEELRTHHRKPTRVVVELDVDDDEFIKMGLKDKVIQILNK
ncbi:helix-turn-helix transcriptional regulator [Bacteroides sp.]|uniref:helix-turn-helix domain-containing protein n=1 Tax=Bacteroides sp. TaxID=29523 RepID=UPI0025C021EC|nr:helix-turn-helix transcriptional regulator [Bacteroides sp.]